MAGVARVDLVETFSLCAIGVCAAVADQVCLRGWIVAFDLRRQAIVANLADEIVQSYRDLPAIEHLARNPLPETASIVAIVEDLSDLIFPGYAHRGRFGWIDI